MSGEPCSPATVEKRASISVFTPGWNSAALVYAETSSVVSSSPKAPEPLACTLRSGIRSRLKCAIWFRKWTSCSTIGPSGPIVRLLRSLGAGAPVSVVEPSPASSEGAVSIEVPSFGWGRSGMWKSLLVWGSFQTGTRS